MSRKVEDCPAVPARQKIPRVKLQGNPHANSVRPNFRITLCRGPRIQPPTASSFNAAEKLSIDFFPPLVPRIHEPVNALSQPEIVGLLRRYADTPMSLADACLVRMAELIDNAVVFTTDSDFRTYRKHGRQTIPVITPD